MSKKPNEGVEVYGQRLIHVCHFIRIQRLEGGDCEVLSVARLHSSQMEDWPMTKGDYRAVEDTLRNIISINVAVRGGKAIPLIVQNPKRFAEYPKMVGR